MTAPRMPVSTEAGIAVPGRLRDRLRSSVVQLNLAGIVLVGFSLLPSRITPSIGGLVALGSITLVAWAVWALGASGRVRDAALVVGGIAGAIGAGTVSATLIAPVIAGLLVVISDPDRSTRALGRYASVVGAALTIAAVAHGITLDGLVSLLAGFAFGVLGGVARRQRRLADAQRAELLSASLSAEREAARVDLLEARSAAARDVHDVLAHSLGGLVIQLDAIEALLERGRVDEAATRAGAARRLAGEGLEEARRAVATLRDPEGGAATEVADDAIDRLVAVHRALGGEASADGDLSLQGIDAEHRAAIVSAAREALVNARRHAPGATVRLRGSRDPHGMVLRVENATPDAAAPSVGGGHGLVGMRERFAALGDGSTVAADGTGDRFVVEIRSVLP